MSLDSNHFVSIVRELTEDHKRIFSAGFEAGYRQGFIEGTAEAKKLLAQTEALIASAHQALGADKADDFRGDAPWGVRS